MGSRTLRLVVPFAAGGPADALARILVPGLSQQLGQPVVVDNRPGAGGTLGAEQVARAPADGSTLLLATSSTHSIAAAVNDRLPYDPERDFSPVVNLASAPGVLLVPASSPARTVPELIALARRQPGRLSYGSSGIGSIVHLTTEYFKAETGTFIVHIPYRGTALALADLAGGTIDLLFDSVVTGLPAARDGRVRALAVTSLAPTALAPDVPPLSQWLPGFQAATWFALFGPRGLPPAQVAAINRAVNGVLADPETRQRFTQAGAEPTGGSVEAVTAFQRADIDRWQRLVATRRLQLEPR